MLEFKTCKDCQVDKPPDDYSRNKARCKPCNSAYTRAYKARNPEATKLYMRRYRTANREQHNAYNRAYQERLRTSRAPIIRAKAVVRNWLGDVRRHMPCPGCGGRTGENATWCSGECFLTHNPPVRSTKRKRRLRESLRRRVFARDGYVCQICQEPTSKVHDVYDDQSPEVDHITPWSEGGLNTLDNLRVAHRKCNRDRNLTRT